VLIATPVTTPNPSVDGISTSNPLPDPPLVLTPAATEYPLPPFVNVKPEGIPKAPE
jgi:hypothetical protein